MSVATKNPFALLDDEDAAPSPPPPAAAQATAPPAAAAARSQQQRGRGPAARGGKYYARGGKTAPKEAPTNGVDEVPGDGQRRSDGEVRERGRGRGRGRGGDRGGRGRQFDKHSATGKTDSDKKIHQSWGGDDGKAELQVEQAASNDVAVESWGGEASTADWGAPAEGTDAPAAEGDAAEKTGNEGGRPRKEREEEEEDTTLTLDQYRAQQKEALAVPKLETRKANDGADGDIWKDVVPLQKTAEEDAYFVGKSKSAPKSRAPKAEKVYLEIDARFERPDRGGRGRGRGDRARGTRGTRGSAPRGGRSNGGNRVVNVDDEAAFPSLS